MLNLIKDEANIDINQYHTQAPSKEMKLCSTAEAKLFTGIAVSQRTISKTALNEM